MRGETVFLPHAGRLLVLSDTHAAPGQTLPPSLLAQLERWEPAAILHAGDVGAAHVLDQLREVAPVYAVQGNTDAARGLALPTWLYVRVGNVTVGMTHGHLGAGRTTRARAQALLGPVQVVVFGHTHQPLWVHSEGVLLVNPGSPLRPRRGSGPTLAVVEIRGDGGVGGCLMAAETG